MPAAVPGPTDDATFTTFLEHTMPDVRRFLRRLCACDADADDVLQDTLAKVWRLRGSFDPVQNGGGWLMQAAFRCFCDHRERLRRRAAPNGDATAAAAPSTPCRAELRDELDHRLQALTALERTLLVGFHRDGSSLRELAAQHALPINTVKSHLHRARQRLAKDER